VKKLEPQRTVVPRRSRVARRAGLMRVRSF
jgi:hypothetical protein